MKHLKSIFNLLLFCFLLFFTAPLQADSGGNKNCANAEIIGEMNTITTSANHDETGRVNNNGNDYYKFTINASGSLDIDVSALTTNNRDYTFYIGNGTCGTWDVYNGSSASTTHTKHNIAITSGDTIYLRVHANGHKSDYDISLDFTKTAIASNTPNVSILPATKTISEGTNSVTLQIKADVAPNIDSINVHYTDGCGGSERTAIIPQDNTQISINISTSTLYAGSECYVHITNITGNNGQLVGNISSGTSTITVINVSSNAPDITISPSTVNISAGTASTDLSVLLSEAGNKDSITVNYVDNCNGGTIGTITIPKGSSSETLNIDTSSLVKDTNCTVVLTGASGTIDQNVGSITSNTSTIKVNDYDFTCANPKDFSIVAQFNTQGNIKLIGNTNICRAKNNDPSTGECVDPGDATNNSTNAIWRKGDSNAGTQNASAAKLDLDANSTILWAGLYWQGYFATSDASTLKQGQIQARNIKLGYSANKGLQNINYTSLTADRINHVYFSASRWYYQGFKDVTSYVQNNGTGWYWGADVPTTLGRPAGGTLGAWSIAIIYQNRNEEIKNLTIFDGYLAFAGNNDINNAISYANDHSCDTTKTGVQHETTMDLIGFKTPRAGTVKSRLLFFAGEGDIGLTGDNLWITDNTNTFKKIENTTNPNNNIANSSITDENVIRDSSLLYPYYGYNTIGIDIDTFDVSNIIGNDQTHTTAKMNTSGDGYFPGIFGLSTDLYKPGVCYDYVTKRNGFIIPYTDKTAYESRAEKDDELSITLAIWDITGDIDPRKVSLGVDITSQQKGHIAPIFSPDKAYYSLKNSNTLLATDYARPMSTTNRPVITIGKGRSTDIGGTISPDERYFSKFFFNVTNPDGDGFIKGDYNVDVNATFNYGSGDFWQLLDIDRCPQDPTYTPTWYQFNVEKVFSTIPSNPTQHYSLPTRIAGKDFNYAVASYTQDGSGEYTVPTAADGTTIDVELIDIGAFDDNGSIFKCGNPDPSIIIMPGNFIYFQNGIKRQNITVNNDLVNTKALRNATFRMWLLIDENGTIATDPSYHDKNDNAYFSQVYTDIFKSQDVNNLCLSACTSPYSYTDSRGGSGCYACLRDFFAQPYCARDNFAIRPKAIKLTLNDRGDDANGTATQRGKNNTTTSIKLAAEYPYQMNLTTVKDNDLIAQGYYSDYFKEQLHLTSVPTYANSYALHKFEDNSACADKEHKTFDVTFTDGLSLLTFKGNNAGAYSFEIWDNNWTQVDRATGNEYKTLFENGCKNSATPACNDCILENPTDEQLANEKTGCVFSSKLTDINGNEKTTYTKMNLEYKPYKYGLDINFSVSPDDTKNYLYMNDLTKNRQMAVKIDGNVSAQGFDGTDLSNYTASCAAEDISLWIDRTMIPNESNITGEGVGATPGTDIDFQQGIRDANGTFTTINNNASNDINSTLGASNFSNVDKNGSAAVDLSFNFKKPYGETVNPIDVNFSMLHVGSTAAISNASTVPDHLPEGNVSISNGERYFYFARITDAGADGKQIYDPSYATTLSVQAYCDPATLAAGMNCGLLPGLLAEDGSWYRMAEHTSAANDGQINSLSTTIAGVTFNGSAPLNNVTFDANGSTAGVTIAYPMAGRPVHPDIVMDVDEWLKYSTKRADGKPSFILHFLTQGLRWKGKGNTGNVIQTEPSNNSNQRLNW